MDMSMMTIQSKSNLLYVLPFEQTSMVIAYTSIIRSHLFEANEIVLLTGKVYPEIGNDSLLAGKQMSSRTIVREGCTS